MLHLASTSSQDTSIISNNEQKFLTNPSRVVQAQSANSSRKSSPASPCSGAATLLPSTPGIRASGKPRARDGSTCARVFLCATKFDVRRAVPAPPNAHIARTPDARTCTRTCTVRPTSCHVYVSKSIFGVTGL